MKRNILQYTMYTVLLMMSSGCNDWLDVQPKSQVKEEELFKDESGFREALLGVYTIMGREATYGGNSTMGFMDALAQTYSNLSDPLDKVPSYDYKDEESKSRITDMWISGYNAIANCNYLLKNVSERGGVMQEDTRKVVEAEALALRAFLHFDLLRGFAPSYKTGSAKTAIPYVKEVTNKPVKSLSVKETLELIVTDLENARQLIKEVDPLGPNGGEYSEKVENKYDFGEYVADDGFMLYRKSRFNYYGITALLARVSLYKEDMTKALSYAEEVIDSGKFDFITEQILQQESSSVSMGYLTVAQSLAKHEYITSVYVYDLKEGRNDLYFRDSYSASCYINENRKQELFEGYGLDLDIRAKRLFSIPESSSKEYVNKYLTGNRIPLLKIGEMYLIAAEASGDADYLDKLRMFRGYTAPLPEDIDLQTEIRKEYQREFIAEGQMFYYYKRQNMAKIPYSVTPMNDNVYIFPQPDDEIEFGYTE